MKMTIDMPFVAECMVNECAYNLNRQCHARAITIGDGVHPGCDTSYLNASAHTHNAKHIAGVGACKVSGCRYNEDFECSADSISVAMKDGDIRCMTYKART
jgi:hypothetical protein